MPTVNQAPKLVHVTRLDSIPLTQTHYTAEGYLVDRPIVTSTGIFEYTEANGSIRRELRLPEDVFDPESLKSYRGKPIIITHDAGLITRENVGDEQIGTIMSDGYRSGEDVRAEIIIHDTEQMKAAGLKELSLGYNLDLEETPGVWNGQRYDAIQRNIRINHLALVREARAGERARLNIDSRDGNTLKGAQKMRKTRKTTHGDSILNDEELAKAIEEYKKRRAQNGVQQDADEEEVPPVKSAKPAAPAATAPQKAVPPKMPQVVTDSEIQDKVEAVKANKEQRAGEDAPVTQKEAATTMMKMDEDMGVLFDIIDTLLAERDFGKTDGADCEEPLKKDANSVLAPDEVERMGRHDEDDEEDEDFTEDGEDEEEDKKPLKSAPSFDEEDDEEDFSEDEDDDPDTDDSFEEDEDDEDEDFKEDEGEEENASPFAAAKKDKLNTDSVDKIVRQRVKLGMIGRKLNMDGLEDMSIRAAKKKIIRAVRPNIRLDGKTNAYINAAFDMACAEVNRRKYNSTDVQKRQMFNKKNRMDSASRGDSSTSARQRMIERQNKKED